MTSHRSFSLRVTRFRRSFCQAIRKPCIFNHIGSRNSRSKPHVGQSKPGSSLTAFCRATTALRVAIRLEIFRPCKTRDASSACGQSPRGTHIALSSRFTTRPDPVSASESLRGNRSESLFGDLRSHLPGSAFSQCARDLRGLLSRLLDSYIKNVLSHPQTPPISLWPSLRMRPHGLSGITANGGLVHTIQYT